MACEQQGPVKSVLEGSFESNSSQDDIAEVFQQEFVTLAAKMGNHAVIREYVGQNPEITAFDHVSLPALSVATLKDIVVNRRLSSYGLAVRIAGQLPSLCPTVQFGVDFGSLLVELKRQCVEWTLHCSTQEVDIAQLLDQLFDSSPDGDNVLKKNAITALHLTAKARLLKVAESAEQRAAHWKTEGGAIKENISQVVERVLQLSQEILSTVEVNGDAKSNIAEQQNPTSSIPIKEAVIECLPLPREVLLSKRKLLIPADEFSSEEDDDEEEEEDMDIFSSI